MDNKALDAQPKTLYVSGILMDYQMDRFLLINKGGMKLKDGTILNWQGIGGHIHTGHPELLEGESPHQAMEREFQEETGHLVKKNRWHCYYIKDYGVTKIYFFVAFASPNELVKLHGLSEEGEFKTHNYVDVLFDTPNYTFDIPYLLNMIIREMKSGFFMKLDPEGINSSGKMA